MKKHLALAQSRQGVALVITLSMLVLITVLVVGFTVNMRTEHQASSAMTGAARAGLMAQSALAHAVSLLQRNIPQPVPPGGSTANPTNWMVNPGLLTTVQGTSTVRQIPLSSNPTASYASTALDANLNAALLDNSGYTILPTSDEMRVAWVPVLQDPSQAAGNTNPLTGRYAFWVDDESAKLNINTAYGKPSNLDWSKPDPGAVAVTATNPAGAWKYAVGHPASLNLDVLSGLSASNISDLAGGVKTYGGFNNIEAIKQYAGAQPDAFFNANKFNLTAWSRAPEFNAFGKSRFFMSRRVIGQLGVSMPMFQFFRDKDAPIYSPTDENKNGADTLSLYYTAAGLSGLLSRSDWPGMPASSFVDKWGGGEVGKRQADQFAWDLVAMNHFAAGDFGAQPTAHWRDYTNLSSRLPSGRAESVGTANYPNAAAVRGALSGKAMIPAYPVPLLDEVRVVITPTPPTVKPGNLPGGKLYLKVSLTVEFWLPPNYSPCDLPGLSFGATYLYSHFTQPGATPPIDATQESNKYLAPPTYAAGSGIKAFSGAFAAPLPPAPPDPPMQRGTYRMAASTNAYYVRNSGAVIDTADGDGFTPTGGDVTCDLKMRLYAGLFTGSAAYPTQIIPMWDSRDGSSAFAIPADDKDAIGTPLDYIELKFTLDKSLIAPGQMITRSLEIADPRLSGLGRMWTPSGDFTKKTTPEIDTYEAVNNATTAAVQAGWDTNKFGYLDLNQGGPTAVCSTSPTPSVGLVSLLSTGSQRGIPGASPRLQPSQNASALPDWLLLDLVASNPQAGNLGPLTLMNSTAGKLNVNANLLPNAGKFNLPARTAPLQALLQNAPASGSGLADNILKHKLATGGVDFGVPGVYDYAGKLCEIAGVADTGASDSDKEALIRNLASCVTTKSNVFSVWGVAQAVKKKPGNVQYGSFETGDNIAGERRFRAVVERYVWPGNDNTAGNAHASPAYDRLSSNRTLPGQAPAYTDNNPSWEPIDGPDKPTYPPAGGTGIAPVNSGPNPASKWSASADPNGGAYAQSTIENANNPAAAVMKYRVLTFRYLNE